MREIKFRAWDKKRKKMIYDYIEDKSMDRDDTYIMIELDGTVHAYDSDDAGKNGLWEHENDNFDLEVMQYTGLKDKNGKEIYEGDIIRDDWLGTAEIRYNDIIAGYWAKLFKRKKYVSMNDIDSEYIDITLLAENVGEKAGKIEQEVIGNIYENPELVKKGKNEDEFLKGSLRI